MTGAICVTLMITTFSRSRGDETQAKKSIASIRGETSNDKFLLMQGKAHVKHKLGCTTVHVVDTVQRSR